MVVFPIIATILALACCIAVLRDYLARPRPAGITWTIAFAIFAVAAGSEVAGSLAGWTPLLARIYYVLGATLVVGYLALGELYLLMRRERVDRIAGLLVLLSALAVALVWNSEVSGDVGRDGWEALERGPALTILTVALNSVGTLVLVGGLLYSAVSFRRRGIMRNRMLGCLLIAVGTLSVAGGGTLTRLGSHQYLYIAMSLGIALIFGGYVQARKPDAVKDPTPQPAQRAPGWGVGSAGGSS
jgi:hypothetical protein